MHFFSLSLMAKLWAKHRKVILESCYIYYIGKDESQRGDIMMDSSAEK